MIATTALLGFKNASRYDAVRPAYPPATHEHVLSALVDSLRIFGWNLRVIELGAGTGLFTRPFLEQTAKTNSHVGGSNAPSSSSSSSGNDNSNNIYTAIEPHASMRQILKDKLPSAIAQPNLFRHCVVDEGSSEHMPTVATNTATAMIATQAFHWMANPKTILELHRVLRPQAPVMLVWNTLRTDVPWQRRLEGALFPFMWDQHPLSSSLQCPRCRGDNHAWI